MTGGSGFLTKRDVSLERREVQAEIIREVIKIWKVDPLPRSIRMEVLRHAHTLTLPGSKLISCITIAISSLLEKSLLFKH